MYDDGRFPGRLIVSLNKHFDSVSEVPPKLFAKFMREVQGVSEVQLRALGADRVNLAILGNQEPHVHCHLIPRYFRVEPRPDRAPWEDPRPRSTMSAAGYSEVERSLRTSIKMPGFELYNGDLAGSASRVAPHHSTASGRGSWVKEPGEGLIRILGGR